MGGPDAVVLRRQRAGSGSRPTPPTGTSRTARALLDAVCRPPSHCSRSRSRTSSRPSPATGEPDGCRPCAPACRRNRRTSASPRKNRGSSAPRSRSLETWTASATRRVRDERAVAVPAARLRAGRAGRRRRAAQRAPPGGGVPRVVVRARPVDAPDRRAVARARPETAHAIIERLLDMVEHGL